MYSRSEIYNERVSLALPVLCGWPNLAAACRHLPEDEAAGVHVDAQEGVAWEVDGALQHLRGHVAPRANLQRDIGKNNWTPKILQWN